MPIVHVVLFGFKPSLDKETISAVRPSSSPRSPTATPSTASDSNTHPQACQRMLGLPDKCRHPETNQPYIKSLGGGKDNSLEGMAHGLGHGFVFQFENKRDRDYYIDQDPAHLEFVASIRELVDKATVFDYEAGVF